MQLHNRSEQILRPPNFGFMLLSLLLALLLNMLPMGELPGMPDWVALVLCIWTIREFRKLSMAWAFLLGIIMDVADAAVLGQHALAYIMMVFGGSELARRIQWFPLTQQGLHVLPILLFVPAIQAVVRYFAGGDIPEWGFFVGPFISALLWMPVTMLLLLPQFRPHERDETRPI